MQKILVTGGTTFVSRYTARWFVQHGYDVWVLNRGTKQQEDGVHLICADRKALGNQLKGMHFDAVLDITAYTGADVLALLDALDSFDDYILISSSAVYPETNSQPFSEEQAVGPNAVWGRYGTDKIAAERVLMGRVQHAYVLRPPYLYGPMQNLYREPFVFDCAFQGRPFYLPKDGGMQLQFFHVEDLCRVMDAVLRVHPAAHIINVGNTDTVSVEEFASLCYRCAGKEASFVRVHQPVPQRAYFCFHDYEYVLDTGVQQSLLPSTVSLAEGLAQSYAWYCEHPDDVIKRDYMAYIDQNF